MATFRITSPDGQTFRIDAPEGATQEQVMAYAQSQFAAQASTPQAAQSEVPAQYTNSPDSWRGKVSAGLDAAQGAPVVGGMVTGLLDPSKGLAQLANHTLNAVSPSLVSDQSVQNFDQNLAVNERNLQEARTRKGGEANSLDMGRLIGNVAVTAPFISKASGRNDSIGTLSTMLRSGGSSGVLGALQPVTDPTKDYWGEKAKQVGTAGAIGFLAPPVVQKAVDIVASGINKLVQTGVMKVADLSGKFATQAQTMLGQELAKNGIDFSKLSADVKSALMSEVQAALNVGGKMDMEALLRKADFMSIGAKPTLGKITLDPQQISKEHTLMGIQGAGQELADVAAVNNRALIAQLNKSGASGALGKYATGEGLVNAGQSMLKDKQKVITALYDNARSLNGGEIALDHVAFITNASKVLDKEMKTAFIPAEIKSILNDIASGKVPLNVTVSEQLKTMLATAMRSSQDGNQRAALGIVRNALEEAPALGQLGKDTVAAFTKARMANRNLRTQVENTPALKDIENEMPVDKFFDKHVLNAPVRDLKATLAALSDDPTAIAQMRAELVDHLKSKALSGASDEVGKFSQTGYNKALSLIPEQKLSLLFNKDEIAQLRTVGRVASYNQVQPAGATVNNSNTAAQMFNLLMKMAERVPFGKMALVQPAQSIINGGASKTALNAQIPVASMANQFVTPKQQRVINALLAPAAVAAAAPGTAR